MGKPFQLDTTVIEPGSIQLSDPFTYEETSRTIVVTSEKQTVRVCYRVLSAILTQKIQARSISTYDDSSGPLEKSPPTGAPIEKEELFAFEGIRKFGAISRGISFGNRQNVFVNSSLNLQMDGQVADNLFLSAVITDQNVPYQPEGNTQQIRDFDNVFIKLYNDKFDATAGDIVLKNEVAGDYFLRYYKNVQGLQVGYRGGKNKWKQETKVSGALSKGKFASTLLEAVEGLSGPYRLRGPNGERFIIILASSEKVFLDGKLMERGFDRDYIIDYNLGEITFNNHVVVTQFSRIRVDFEYAEEFYSRSNLSFSQTVSNDRLKLYSGFYRERDNPNNNFGFILNDEDIASLQSIGDQVDQAFVTGFDTVGFEENRILYEQKDTTDLDGNVQTIFQLSSNSSQELFAPTFSDAGEGNGDYVLQQTTSNGRVYEWVSPQNGIRQGRYEPGAFIPLPNSRQLFNVGGEVKLNEHETVFSEVALSDTDLNLYATIDDEDNQGLGYYGGIRSANRPSFLPGYTWSGSLTVEFDQADFSFMDRYRSIEFDRNWDLDLDSLEGTFDLIVFGKGSLYQNEANQLSLSVNHRKRASRFRGFQRSLIGNKTLGEVSLRSRHSYLDTQQGTFVPINSTWLQSQTDLSYRKWKLVPGYVFQLDENALSQQDSVITTRMNFRSHEFYLTNGDSTKSSYRLSYNLRQDRLPVAGRLEDFLFSRNFNAQYQRSGQKNQVGLDFNYRSVADKLGLNEGQSEIVNGRLTWRSNFFRNHLTQNFSFSTGNSRELRREFVYVPVTTGEGTHTWRDLNEDGVQDLNEFFEAINADERNFVKIFTPTDEYIVSFQTFYIHTIDLRTPRRWKGKGGWKSLASNFSANLNFNVTYRTVSDNYEDRLNPFSLKLDDADLLSVRDTKRYTLFFNRNRRGLAGDFAYLTSDNKQLLTQGFESRVKEEWVSNVKVDLSGEYTLRLTSVFGTLTNQSDFLTSRNLEIVSSAYEPQLIWQPRQNIRIIGSYELENKQNELLETSDESSQIQRYKVDLTWNKSGKGSLRSAFSWVDIQFSGDETTYLAYLLLEALQPGTNQTWQVNWQQKLTKGMQLSLLYNGRKSDTRKSIHTGSVQVTAFF